ncbi:MAG: hypothetical protein NUW37_11345 [Planctomycetes bacterium]|nr:hypothetical protein [Planctomycetota bacterium]
MDRERNRAGRKGLAQIDGETYVINQGGGLMIFLGVFFLIPAIIMFGVGLANAPSNGDLIPLLIVGGVFAILGIIIATIRWGLIIDKSEGTITSWWRMLFVLGSTKVYGIEEGEGITITQEIRRTKNSSYTVWPVRIKIKGDRKVNITETRDPGSSREVAEELARFIGFKIIDTSMGGKIERNADEIDMSLKEQVQAHEETPELIDQPADSRVTFEKAEGGVTFVIPPAAKTALGKFNAIGIGCIVFIVLGLAAFLIAGNFDEEAIVPIAIFGVIFAAIAFAVRAGFAKLKALFASEQRITVTKSNLSVAFVYNGREKIEEIPADKLEELQIVGARESNHKFSGFEKLGSGVLMARSDFKTIRFAFGLSNEELEWLKSAIMVIVTSD